MKFWLILLGIWGFVLTSTLRAQTSDEVVDRIMAIVGDQVILESDVFEYARNAAAQQNPELLRDPTKFQALELDVLREMINQKVLLVKAKEDTITVESRAVDRELENRLQSIVQSFGSEERVEKEYGQPISRLRRSYRPLVEEALIIEKMRQEYFSQITITRNEVEQYFKDHPEVFPPMQDGVLLDHILRELKGNTGAEQRARNLADSLYTAIKAGASFDSLAGEFSDDPGSAKKFGSVGWTEPGSLINEYENAAEALQIGEISRPIKSLYGYHLIRLEDRKDTRVLSSHILITTKVNPEDEQVMVDSLNAWRNRILGGISFQSAAREASDDLQSSTRGGSLGWLDVAEMPEDFKMAIDTLETGEISKPFKTQYGYHLVQLRNRRSARALTLDQDWETIYQRALNAKLEREYDRWLGELKERYYIEIKK